MGTSAIRERRHIIRLVLVGCYTGTRPGTIPVLLWEEALLQAWVDLDDEIIYRRGKGEKEHKTKRRPLVKIPGRLLRRMRHWRRQDLAAVAREREAAQAAGREPREGWTTVLHHHGGQPLAGRVRRGFEACVRDAGLPEGVTPHWLRHTCATWLMEAGVDVWKAAGFTGMTPATLEKCYGHHRPDHQEDARKALGG